MLSVEEGDGIRFRMLETLRAWAWSHLQEDEHAALTQHHAAFFSALAEEAKPRLKGPEQADWLDKLGCEHDNLRAAFEGFGAAPDSLQDALRLAGSLYDFWYLRGHVREAGERYTSLLARPGADSARLAVLGPVINSAGLMAAWQGKLDAAQGLFERSLALMRAAGNDNGEAVALSNIGIALEDLGRLPEAEEALAESLHLRRALGDLSSVGISLTNLGSLYAAQGRLDEARACCRESLCLQRDAGCLTSLLFPLLNLVELDHGAGLWERAARLWGAASALRKAQGIVFTPAEQQEQQELADDARAHLGAAAFARAWADGEALTVEQAIALALQAPDTAP